MKHKLFLTLLLFIAIKSYSQDSRLSLEANFQIPIGDNFIGDKYGGIVDFGAKYRFSKLKSVNIGASINGGFLKNYKDKANLWDLNLYTIQPRIFTEFNVKSLNKLHPHLALGYSFLIFKASQNGTSINNIKENDSGINLNLGISYDLTDKLFLQTQYDFIKIKASRGALDIPYNTNINILKFGIGLRL